MKTRSYSLTTVCMVMTLVSVLFLFQPSAYAQIYVHSVSIQMHNGDSQHRTATDLHFRVALPYNYGYFIPASLIITTTPSLGSYSTGTYTDPQTGNHIAYDVAFNPISVPYCTTVKLDITAKTRLYSSFIVDFQRWSYPPSPDSDWIQVCPYHIAYLHAPDKPDSTATSHDNFYTFYNADSASDLQINDLQFYLDTVWYGPEEQWNPIGTLIAEWTGPLVLHPGDSLLVPLDSIPNGVRNYIYVAGEMEYQMSDSDPAVVEFRQGNQEPLPPYTTIPTLTEWGLIILCILLFASGAWVIVRRKRATEVSI